ncbi:MAG TPA: gamma-glutamyl-gamma-aminobutyrate hydrolase family protein [Thermoanaerobaculia bacterium]|jgi:putative glutamine amidotransferase|nr:gamma-glutamyl-gamma-aminobutyrate hydrolase family protein [Thermoanaerobaculia bacterium]
MRIALTLDRDATRREENDYVRALINAGFARGEIDVVAPGRRPTESFDGLLLGGGSDVDPARYGRGRIRGARVQVDPERDETDFTFLDRAMSQSLPVLGICRGIQVVNVALGGTLVQDIDTERPSSVVHRRSAREKTRLDHVVSIRPGTRLRAIAGAEEIAVNSRHHQAVGELGRGLVFSARAPDGLVEAVERPGEPVLAVQWHPENLAGDPASRRLFEDFAVAVTQRLAVETGKPSR